MLFRLIAIAILFLLLRNLFKSWKLFQQLEAQHKAGGNFNKSKGTQSASKGDDIIDAEYTVVDK